MGGGSFNPTAYAKSVDHLKATGATFARAATASATGDFTGSIAEILDPRKLKNGMRESCYTPGFNDATPIIVAIDCTGSMSQVPMDIQKKLPSLIEMLVQQGISDHPNVAFMAFDDEHVVRPTGAFQMSQFEIDATKLTEALNEMVIPKQGGGNDGEAYHIAFYAAAYHTKLECFDKNGEKGFFVMICDEQPYYDAKDPAKHGMKPAVAEACFGDVIEKEISMLESVRKVCERYHVFVIRPGETQHGRDHGITKMWQDLLEKAGENPEHVLEIASIEEVIPAVTVAIGRLTGADDKGMVDVLAANGIDASKALVATRGVSTVTGKAVATIGKSDAKLATTADSGKGGRTRR